MTENLELYPRLGYREIDRRLDQGFQRVFFSKRLWPSETSGARGRSQGGSEAS